MVSMQQNKCAEQLRTALRLCIRMYKSRPNIGAPHIKVYKYKLAWASINMMRISDHF